MDFRGGDNVPIKYKMDVEKLLLEIKAASKLTEIRNLFLEFAQIYTMIPSLWLEWIR